MKSLRATWFRLRHPRTSLCIRRIKRARLTLCSRAKLRHIATAIHRLRARGVAGDYIEAGCALGGSAILIARCKPRSARLDLFDVFGLIPPPGERDGAEAHQRYERIAGGRATGPGGDPYYGYTPDLEQVVRRNLIAAGLDLARDRIRLVPGLFEETMQPPDPVAFAHIDCDWYDSVKVCLDRIVPKLAEGGLLVFDDYHSYAGCRRAVDERLADGGFVVLNDDKSLTVMKQAGAAGRPFNLDQQAGRRWDARAVTAVRLARAIAAELPDRPARVADLGCGNERLREVLARDWPGPTDYQGYDLAPQSPAVRPLDVHRDMPPDRRDLVFCLGLLEYLADLDDFLRRLREAGRFAVLSYVCADRAAYSPEQIEALGWRSHHTADEIEARLADAGWTLRRRADVGAKGQLCWLIECAGE